jgi:hypothetical protein
MRALRTVSMTRRATSAGPYLGGLLDVERLIAVIVRHGIEAGCEGQVNKARQVTGCCLGFGVSHDEGCKGSGLVTH